MRRIAAVFLFLVCLACVVSGIALMSGLGFNDIARSVRFLAGLILAVVVTGRTEFLLGRLVEVQRKTGAGWLRVKRGRLVRTRDGSFVTIFRVPTRGLTLRVFAPHATGAPCFSAAASNTWRS